MDVRNSNIAHGDVYDPNSNGYHMTRSGHMDLPRYDSSVVTPPKNTMYYDTSDGGVKYKDNTGTVVTLG